VHFSFLFKAWNSWIGGGLAVIGQMRTMTVRDRRWLTEAEFAEAFALAQSLPGTFGWKRSDIFGFRLRGWRGAICAICRVHLPSMAMMIVLFDSLIGNLRSIPNTDMLFHGYERRSCCVCCL